MDRLTKIFNCIPQSNVVADIGCDHGRLTAMLITQGRAQRTVAADISPKSLSKAMRLCEFLGITGRVDFRQGDGLGVLAAGEADTIVIAGMGGHLITEMLRGRPDLAKEANLVLCPHTHEEALRRFLLTNGFCITAETIAQEDGRYYQIICAKSDGMRHAATDDFYYAIGEKLLEGRDESLAGYLKYRLRLAREIAENARKSSREKALRDASRMTAFAERLEEIIRCLQP
jgi:tRNA (adenine22-N1)-methyltransferase